MLNRSETWIDGGCFPHPSMAHCTSSIAGKARDLMDMILLGFCLAPLFASRGDTCDDQVVFSLFYFIFKFFGSD